MMKFVKSFRHAADGIHSAASTERNFRIELVLAAGAFALSWVLPLSVTERAMVFLTIGIILALELLNTAFEQLTDMLSPQFHEKVKTIKDLAAGAVLLSSFSAVLVGLVIFAPHLVALFS
ncbi:MAG: diacylglycerol kinase family protein [Candidatus Moranbacteria bacterium]|nr:diacylglycerol kinase family protein [Candidatus Moranbacteria bacterium]